jgi:hypothetical protein
LTVRIIGGPLTGLGNQICLLLNHPMQAPYGLGSENERRLILERGDLCVSVYSTKAKASQ